MEFIIIWHERSLGGPVLDFGFLEEILIKQNKWPPWAELIFHYMTYSKTLKNLLQNGSMDFIIIWQECSWVDLFEIP